ncbi:hypothetical protein BDD12DRAFT_790065 [Trichophaea hybrida]|nr:hypothetical protein BDD12DRAFT_790065 [Trichophaea hybrida]
MLPPGHGDSSLEIGERFVISIYGSEKVLTAESICLSIRLYTGDPTQIWKCMQCNDNHVGFLNVGTRKYLGRNSDNGTCFSEGLGSWERLTFTNLGTGGYRLFFNVEGSLRAARLGPDSDGTYLKCVKNSNTIIGLHRIENPVFSRFKWVIPGRLARSSTPHYEFNDEDQNMNTEAVEFLSRHGITNVINLNTCPLSWTELAALYSKGITYTHIAIQDFQAPTLEEFDTINSNFTAAGTTLVCGGFGHGRVGTAISALQLYSGRRLRRTDFKENYVQTEAQFNELDQLKHKLEREQLQSGQLKSRTLVLPAVKREV